MFRVPLFREVRCIIGQTLGIRWDGMGVSTPIGMEIGENVLALSIGIGMGETGIGLTLCATNCNNNL